MVYVRLEQQWTDSAGTTHQPGAMVDVDAGTLARLQADGTVSEDGAGNGQGEAGTDNAGWAGPDGGGGTNG